MARVYLSQREGEHPGPGEAAAVFYVLGAGFLVPARSHTQRHHLSVAWPSPFLEPFRRESNFNRRV